MNPEPTAGPTRRAPIGADPGLSRFDPLPRILFYDDFDHHISPCSRLLFEKC